MSSEQDEIKPRRNADELPAFPPPEKMNIGQKFFYNLFHRPVVWFRENIVIPGRAGNVYYHRKFQRVPTIDECFVDDPLCAWEATMQWRRDRKVETKIVEILKARWEHCVLYYRSERNYDQCEVLMKDYEEAMNAHFTKNGDLGVTATARDAYFKQVHRLIMERREAEAKKAREEAAGDA